MEYRNRKTLYRQNRAHRSGAGKGFHRGYLRHMRECLEKDGVPFIITFLIRRRATRPRAIWERLRLLPGKDGQAYATGCPRHASSREMKALELIEIVRDVYPEAEIEAALILKDGSTIKTDGMDIKPVE